MPWPQVMIISASIRPECSIIIAVESILFSFVCNINQFIGLFDLSMVEIVKDLEVGLALPI